MGLLPVSEIRQEAKDRFPDFTGKERKKIAVLLSRKKLLEQLPVQTDRVKAEAAALDWVLKELEEMEHDYEEQARFADEPRSSGPYTDYRGVCASDRPYFGQ